MALVQSQQLQEWSSQGTGNPWGWFPSPRFTAHLFLLCFHSFQPLKATTSTGPEQRLGTSCIMPLQQLRL